MITISSIDTPNPRQRARRVYFVETPDFHVTSSLVLSALEIGVADTFSSLEDFENRIEEAAFECAKQRAFRLLSMRDYTTFEIASKLKDDGFSASVGHKVTAYLCDVSFCNDGQYLERIIDRCIEEGIGSRKLRQKLAKKGFPKELIEATLEEKLDEDALSLQFATARRLVSRFDVNDRKQRDKAFRRLVTRGYSFDIANKVLHERCEQEFHIDSSS